MNSVEKNTLFEAASSCERDEHVTLTPGRHNRKDLSKHRNPLNSLNSITTQMMFYSDVLVLKSICHVGVRAVVSKIAIEKGRGRSI